MRSAEDLKAALPLAQKGYAATADFYRNRATSLTDPALQTVQLRMADELSRLAADTPKESGIGGSA